MKVRLAQAGHPKGDAGVEWLKANGVDEKLVMAWQDATVEDGTIALDEFQLSITGFRTIINEEGSFAKRRATYPLVVPPDEFGLETVE